MIKNVNIQKGSVTWHLKMDGDLIKEVSYSGEYGGIEDSLFFPEDIRVSNFGCNIGFFCVKSSTYPYTVTKCKPYTNCLGELVDIVYSNNAYATDWLGVGTDLPKQKQYFYNNCITLCLSIKNSECYDLETRKRTVDSNTVSDTIIPEGVVAFVYESYNELECVHVSTVYVPKSMCVICKQEFNDIAIAVEDKDDCLSINFYEFCDYPSLCAKKFIVDAENKYFCAANHSLVYMNGSSNVLMCVDESVNDYVISDDIDIVAESAIVGCKDLRSIHIGKHVKCIGRDFTVSYGGGTLNNNIKISGGESLRYMGQPGEYPSCDTFEYGVVPPNIVICEGSTFASGTVIFPACFKHMNGGENPSSRVKVKVLGIKSLESVYNVSEMFPNLEVLYTCNEGYKSERVGSGKINVVFLSEEQYDRLYQYYWENGGKLPENWSGDVEELSIRAYKKYASKGRKIIHGLKGSSNQGSIDGICMSNGVLSFAKTLVADSIFASSHGNYVCQSKLSKVSVDTKAVSAITDICKKLCSRESVELVDWYLLDVQNGLFEFGVTGIQGKNVEDVCSFQYNPCIKKFVSSLHPEGVNNKLFNMLSSIVSNLITSLCTIDIPFDLFEVSLSGGTSRSNDGYVLTGVSTICKENGFKEENLYGKSAMLIVL